MSSRSRIRDIQIAMASMGEDFKAKVWSVNGGGGFRDSESLRAE